MVSAARKDFAEWPGNSFGKGFPLCGVGTGAVVVISPVMADMRSTGRGRVRGVTVYGDGNIIASGVDGLDSSFKVVVVVHVRVVNNGDVVSLRPQHGGEVVNDDGGGGMFLQAVSAASGVVGVSDV